MDLEEDCWVGELARQQWWWLARRESLTTLSKSEREKLTGFDMGWKKEELEILGLSVLKYGMDHNTEMRRHLPGKSKQMICEQICRTITCQGLRRYQGLHLDICKLGQQGASWQALGARERRRDIGGVWILRNRWAGVRSQSKSLIFAGKTPLLWENGA